MVGSGHRGWDSVNISGGSMRRGRRPLATSWEGLILGTWAACLGKDSSAMWGAWEHRCAGFLGPLGSGRPEGSTVGMLGFPLSDIQE